MQSDDRHAVILATRVTKEWLPSLLDTVKGIRHPSVTNVYIVCDASTEQFLRITDGLPRYQLIYDPDPIRITALNLAIDEINKHSETRHHMLTFSREVQLRDEHISAMLAQVSTSAKCIVAGYRLKDTIISDEERQHYMGGHDTQDCGIAYATPWSTCALWNREFVCGKGSEKLWFDEICEKNTLGHLSVEVGGVSYQTPYAGMEDGLAIAKLVSACDNLEYVLIDQELPWRFDGTSPERRLKHIVKMARKNAVLEKFIQVRGYSTERLIKARRIVKPNSD